MILLACSFFSYCLCIDSSTESGFCTFVLFSFGFTGCYPYSTPRPYPNLPSSSPSAILSLFWNNEFRPQQVEAYWMVTPFKGRGESSRMEIKFQLSGNNFLFCGGYEGSQQHSLCSRCASPPDSFHTCLLARGLCITEGESRYSVRLWGVCPRVICHYTPAVCFDDAMLFPPQSPNPNHASEGGRAVQQQRDVLYNSRGCLDELDMRLLT